MTRIELASATCNKCGLPGHGLIDGVCVHCRHTGFRDNEPDISVGPIFVVCGILIGLVLVGLALAWRVL